MATKKPLYAYCRQLLAILSTFLKKKLRIQLKCEHLVKIVLTIRRRPNRRFSKGTEYLPYRMIACQDIDSTT